MKHDTKLLLQMGTFLLVCAGILFAIPDTYGLPNIPLVFGVVSLSGAAYVQYFEESDCDDDYNREYD